MKTRLLPFVGLRIWISMIQDDDTGNPGFPQRKPERVFVRAMASKQAKEEYSDEKTHQLG